MVKHAFGINPHVKNCLAFSDDHHLAYACGHQVVVVNTETKDQGFIQLGTHQQYQSLGLTAICSSFPKKYIAVAEKSDPVGIVNFYDSHSLRKKKTLNFSELGSREIRSMAFSEDGRFFITQGSGPEWNLVLWNVEKTAKVICTTKVATDDTPIHQVSFCPWDSTVIVAFGKCIARIFRVVDGQLRGTTLSLRRDQANFISHCWVPDISLIIGTEQGEILFVENLDFRAVIYPPSTGMVLGIDDGAEHLPIYSLAPTSRGGFVAGSGDGEVKVFEKQEELKEQYQLDNSYRIPGAKGNVNMIAIGTDDSLVLATDTQHLMYFTVSSLQHAKDGSGFENLFMSFHGPNIRGESAVTGIDVALWKPIVVTCGKDKTVRVWNPADKKIEVMKEFEEEPTSLSVHPSGIYVAVGFNDKIKIMAVLLDDLSLCKEVTVRYCSFVKFSRGGHFIAAVNASNIQVFNTFTGALICTLRGHNNKIRNLVWLNFDARLMSVGSEGNVFFWDIFPASRRPEQYQNPVPFLAGTCPSDGSRAFVVTSDRVVREVAFTKTIDPVSGLECSIKDPRDIDIGRVGSVAFLDQTRNILLLGTGDDDLPGAVLAVPAYSQLSSVFETTILHSAAVTAIAMTYDGSLVCTADANGCIVLSEYEGVSAAAGKLVSKAREGTGTASFEFHEEVTVHKTDLEARKSLIADLAARVDELNLNNEHQMRLKEMEHKNKIKEISLKFTGQLRAETEKYDKLFQEKSDTEDTYKSRMAALHEKQQNSLRLIDVKYKTKLNAESNRHKLMMKETEEAHRRWNEENVALVESHQAYLSELSADYEDKLHAEQSMQKKLQYDRETIQVSFDGSRLYCEQDADIEITEMKIK